MTAISIVTVVYNNQHTIRHCIDSVLSQRDVQIEHIVIDGCSADGTVEIVRGYGNRIATFVSEPDKGVYDAMNKGVKLATGDIITTLNSDDVYADDTVVAQMVEFIQENSLDAAYGDVVYVSKHDPNRFTRYWRTGEYKRGRFCYGWAIPHPAFFCRREIFERYGYFNEQFRIAGDFELMLRFIEKHRIKVGYLPRVLVRMRTAGRANVLPGVIQGNWEIMRSFGLNGLRLSPWFFVYKPLMKISQLLARPTCDE